ncbi:MAG: replicative DNA helicase [Candidatus Magnetoglobus multicellularis str. Araruama]|uniref:Replicative DNA helicase n=1 Tax=Candidatus Magnetoglobus multicellularis str. Araruama TaxID=890399 RepID=A0A1V1PEY4_9BACT|nr:MAG: replicative DNA helicase [Candidatus Magnetoglobus multicellularis str. Araruama]
MNLERRVLSALLKDNNFARHSHLIDTKMFSEGAGKIFEAYLFLYSEDKELNKDNISYQLKLSSCSGGVHSLFEAILKISTKENIKDMLEIFIEDFKQRTIAEFRNRLNKLSADKAHSKELTIRINQMNELMEYHQAKQTETLEDVAERVKDIFDNSSVIKTGYKEIDKFWVLTGGNTFALLGDTNQGKSSVGFCIALSMCRRGHRVAYVSVEVSKEEMLAKAISLLSKKSGNYVQTEMTKADLIKYSQKLKKANINNLFIIDEKDEIGEILSDITRLKKKHGIDVIIVDHIQLLRTAEVKSAAADEKTINNISKRLKRFSRTTDLPIIELGQLNSKDVERAGNNPSRSHCRHSSAPVNDASGVILVHRPSTYGTKKYRGYDTHKTMFLINDKGRFGGTGISIVGFEDDYGLMYSLNNEQLQKRKVGNNVQTN